MVAPAVHEVADAAVLRRQNEYSTYCTTYDREHAKKSNFHVSLATTKGIGPRPPSVSTTRRVNGIFGGVKSAAATRFAGNRGICTLERNQPNQYVTPEEAQHLAFLNVSKKHQRSSHSGLQSQVGTGHDPAGLRPDHFVTHNQATVASYVPDSDASRAAAWPWHKKTRTGASMNNKPTANLVGGFTDCSFGANTTEMKASFAHPVSAPDNIRFKTYLVREHCHVADPAVEEPFYHLTPFQLRRLKKKDPMQYAAFIERNPYLTETKSAYRSRGHGSLVDQVRNATGKHSTMQSVMHAHTTGPRDKLLALQGIFRKNPTMTSYARSVTEVPDVEGTAAETLNPTMMSGKLARGGISRRLEQEGQQRCSMTHGMHIRQTTLPTANEGRLVKNPPFCRDGVHPTTTDLEFDGTLRSDPPNATIHAFTWDRMKDKELLEQGNLPTGKYRHKIRETVTGF